MEKLSLREQIGFGLVFNETRGCQHWYPRFLICGVDLERIRRVARRIKNWYQWCSGWSKEGESLENLAMTPYPKAIPTLPGGCFMKQLNVSILVSTSFT